METRFPEPDDGFSLIYREETDKTLSSQVQWKNNTRYAYFKKIAQGGKCLIQTCKDLHLGRVVCYKTLRPEIAEDPYEQQRFLREARVTAMLQHTNTAPVYELGRDTKGHYYFTMKLVVGETLREVLDALREARDAKTAPKPAWDLERLIDVVIQISQVLDFAHTHGVVHRDVKPENIVVGAFGEVLLLDWGLAKVWDESESVGNGSKSHGSPGGGSEADSQDSSLTAQGPLQATPLYMSPEQIAGAEVDHRTDIYSLGAVLFEVLTLEHLAWGDTLDEMLQNKTDAPPPTPSAVSPDRNIPAALETVCFRCIKRSPEHRIQSIRELIHELLYWRRVEATFRP